MSNYPKVLVVEDDPMVRIFAVELFEDAGAQVVEARNAAHALEVLAAHPDVSLVFTDVRMPGERNGLDLARALRQSHPQLHVVVTSGHLPDGEAGIPFVPKPWRAEDIDRLVRTLAAVDQGDDLG